MGDGIQRQVAGLLETQSLAVLCTRGDRLHASLVAIAAGRDLRTVLFATDRHTEKFTNLAAHPEAALLVHNARGAPEDFQQAMALTIQGRTREAEPGDREGFDRVFLGRHPALADFLGAPNTARMVMEVDTYRLVRRFAQVQILRYGP
jgi:hypothetical protein